MAFDNDTLTAIDGLKVGHAILADAATGCTVILCGQGMSAGVDIRGGAPGTYGTDTLNPVNLVDQVHGLFLTGGSAFGLEAAHGLMRFLGERKIGFDTGYERIPIVAGAVIFDLSVNRSGRHPGADLAYQACLDASSRPVVQGCEGAGAGASVGKLRGFDQAMKAGLGSSCVRGADGLKVASLMVLNAFGDVFDPARNRLIAGCRTAPDSRELLDTDFMLKEGNLLAAFPGGQNTIVGVVATNARLNKVQLTKVAQMAHDGMARTVFPAHTQYDGDTIFAVSSGELDDVEVSVVGALAAQAVANGIVNAALTACEQAGLPAASQVTPAAKKF